MGDNKANKKETNSILEAFHLGMEDSRNRKIYNNPFNKQKDKAKYKAYKNGFHFS